MTTFSETIMTCLKRAGLRDVNFLSEACDEGKQDYAEYIFKYRHIIIKIISERGEKFLFLASVFTPNKFYVFDDIELAFGWRSIESVLSKSSPDSLNSVLNRFAAKGRDLCNLFSEDQIIFTNSRIHHSSKVRGKAFLKKLKDLTKK